MLGIVLLLSVLTAAMLFGLSEESEPVPMAKMELQVSACDYELRHVSGEPIDGNRTELVGVDDAGALEGRELAAGDSQRLESTAEEIELVWSPEDGDETYVIGRFDADPDDAGGSWGCPGTVYTAESGSIDGIESDDGSVQTLSSSTDVQALGPAYSDLTGDGTTDVPFVNSSGAIKLTNSSNGTTTIAESSDIPGNIQDNKTRLAVGSWDGSAESVFFVNENHDTLYRVTPSGSPVQVATPADGAQAVNGVGDVDGDGTDELIFADGSQQLRYIEPGGSVKNLNNGQTGSSSGIGAGAVADFDGDGVASVVAVDGSNEVKITSEPTADGGEGTTNVSATDAKKAPPTVADVDGDGDEEIVYVGNATGKLKYVDNVRSGNDIEFLEDEDGNRIDGSDETGLV
jgi:hypothetical protein